MNTNNSVITFKTSAYFLQNVYFVGIMGLIIGVILILASEVPVLGVTIIVLTSPLWLLRRGVSINTEDKTVKEFKQFLFLKIGNPQPYTELVELRLVAKRMSQAMGSRGSSSTIRYTLYTIKLVTDSDIYELESSKNQEKSIQSLTKYAELLGIPAVH